MDNDIVRAIQEASALSRADRLSRLGAQLRAEGLGVDEGEDIPNKELGERFFHRAIASLKTNICENETVKELAGTTVATDRARLALVIFDIFSLMFGGPPAALLTAELLERGIRVYCKDLWQEDD